MTLDEAIDLWEECEQFETFGTLPDLSRIRTLAFARNKRAHVTDFLMVTREAYLVLAQEFVSREKARWRG